MWLQGTEIVKVISISSDQKKRELFSKPGGITGLPDPGNACLPIVIRLGGFLTL